MKRATWIGMLVWAMAASWAFADGMIVPTRPEFRVSGNWAVKYHKVKIKVEDQVASVSIDEEFVNLGAGNLEVEYIFPVAPDAAIDSMTLMVNGQEFAAKLYKSDEARAIYEEHRPKEEGPGAAGVRRLRHAQDAGLPVGAQQARQGADHLQERLQEGRRPDQRVVPAEHGEVLRQGGRGGRGQRGHQVQGRYHRGLLAHA